MSHWEDYYKILQVDSSAEPEIIESAYKRLCKKYHPDLNQSWSAEETIRAVNRAYEVLRSDSSRRQYHRQWLKNNRLKIPPANLVTIENKDHNHLAKQAVQDYFQAISLGQYDRAFALLTQRDKGAIPQGEFMEWQTAVGQVYTIGSFQIRLFKKLEHYQRHNVFYREALEYEIETTEKNLLTGQVIVYRVTKTVVKEAVGWRIYLGYDNLQPLIQKFRYLSETESSPSLLDQWAAIREKTDELTGLPNQAGFMEQAAKEIYRHSRYGTIFSLAAFIIDIPEDQPADQAQGEQWHIVKETAFLLAANIRDTDFSAHLGGGRLLVLLSQTAKAGAKEAAKKIALLLSRSLADVGTGGAGIYAGVGEYHGQDLPELIERCFSRARRGKNLTLSRKTT